MDPMFLFTQCQVKESSISPGIISSRNRGGSGAAAARSLGRSAQNQAAREVFFC